MSLKPQTRTLPRPAWFLRVWKARIPSALIRARQLISRGPADLLWLTYVLGIAPWAHRAAGPLYRLQRWSVRRARRSDVDHRLERLRARIGPGFVPQGGYRVALAQLCPELDKICRPLRRENEEIPLASIDQDGFHCPRFETWWSAPRVQRNGFLARDWFELTVVDRDGWVGVRKSFRGDKVAFTNELEAALDLAQAGCPVPPILAVDFEGLSITFVYIDGVVVREALAQSGAPMRDRDVRPSGTGLSCRKIHRERRAVGRRLIGQVIDSAIIMRIGEALLAIHRAGFTLGDVKYGNILIENSTKTPFFIDHEQALPLRHFSRSGATYFRDRDAEELNYLFGTSLLTANVLRRLRFDSGALYSPFYAGYGIWKGSIWNPDLGVLRWRHMLAEHVPVPRGGRVLDLGANNGFNALQMLRAGAREVVAVEIDHMAIEQSFLVKRIFEWADNVEYRLSYIHGSHNEVGGMNLGKFDLITAFYTLYYLSAEAMAKTVSDLAKLTDTLVLQCNHDHSIGRDSPETFVKASLAFNVELVKSNGFPNVTVIERRGSNRPLVIARAGAGAS